MRSFRYAGEVILDWEPRRIVTSLLECAEDSLEELDLNYCERDDLGYSSERRPMGFQRDLENPRHLKVLVSMPKKPDGSIFLGVYPVNQQGIDSYVAEDNKLDIENIAEEFNMTPDDRSLHLNDSVGNRPASFIGSSNVCITGDAGIGGGFDGE